MEDEENKKQNVEVQGIEIESDEVSTEVISGSIQQTLLHKNRPNKFQWGAVLLLVVAGIIEMYSTLTTPIQTGTYFNTTFHVMMPKFGPATTGSIELASAFLIITIALFLFTIWRQIR